MQGLIAKASHSLPHVCVKNAGIFYLKEQMQVVQGLPNLFLAEDGGHVILSN